MENWTFRHYLNEFNATSQTYVSREGRNFGALKVSVSLHVASVLVCPHFALPYIPPVH